MGEKKGTPPKFRNLKEFQIFLAEAFEGANPDKMLDAIGAGARSFGVTELSEITGQRRENFYRKLSRHGNPGFKDVVQVLSVMGIDLEVQIRPRWSHHTHSDLRSVITDLQADGVSTLSGLARALTELGVPTAQGFRAWSPAQVSRALARLGRGAPESGDGPASSSGDRAE